MVKSINIYTASKPPQETAPKGTCCTFAFPPKKRNTAHQNVLKLRIESLPSFASHRIPHLQTPSQQWFLPSRHVIPHGSSNTFPTAEKRRLKGTSLTMSVPLIMASNPRFPHQGRSGWMARIKSMPQTIEREGEQASGTPKVRLATHPNHPLEQMSGFVANLQVQSWLEPT